MSTGFPKQDPSRDDANNGFFSGHFETSSCPIGSYDQKQDMSYDDSVDGFLA